MKLLIADDEAPARQWMRHLVQQLGSPFELIGEAATGNQAVELCRSEPVDLVLLDISMPGLNGLEAAGMLARFEHPPAVIFTTAYEEHALEAFDRHAVDYLLKPVRLERLQRALARARTLSRAHLRALDELQSAQAGQRGQSALPADPLRARWRGSGLHVLALHGNTRQPGREGSGR